jgi:GNAT superfamily N-acetyltransferase
VESTCAYYRLPQVAAARQFAVDPELQRTGIGILLLKRAEAWAAEQGYRELGIDTAAPAVHLLEYYQKLGFEPVGRVQWEGKTYVSVVLGKLVNAVSNGVEQEQPS